MFNLGFMAAAITSSSKDVAEKTELGCVLPGAILAMQKVRPPVLVSRPQCQNPDARAQAEGEVSAVLDAAQAIRHALSVNRPGLCPECTPILTKLSHPRSAFGLAHPQVSLVDCVPCSAAVVLKALR